MRMTEEKASMIYDSLRTRATDLIPEILALRAEKMDEYVSDHNSDVKSYRFDCERFGDFLLMKVARGNEKYGGSVNLGSVTEISLKEGHGPDHDGSVSFTSSNSIGHPSKKPSYCVNAVWSKPCRRRTVTIQVHKKTDDRSHAMHWGHDFERDALSGLRVDNCPRAAEDDRIYLLDVATIYAPAGVGSAVYRKILASLASGWDSKPRPKTT